MKKWHPVHALICFKVKKTCLFLLFSTLNRPRYGELNTFREIKLRHPALFNLAFSQCRAKPAGSRLRVNTSHIEQKYRMESNVYQLAKRGQFLLFCSKIH